MQPVTPLRRHGAHEVNELGVGTEAVELELNLESSLNTSSVAQTAHLCEGRGALLHPLHKLHEARGATVLHLGQDARCRRGEDNAYVEDELNLSCR